MHYGVVGCVNLSQCSLVLFLLELATNDARNRGINGHAVADEELDDGLLVLHELALDHVHVTGATFSSHVSIDK